LAIYLALLLTVFFASEGTDADATMALSARFIGVLVVLSRKIPFADIGMVEIDVRMAPFRQFNHSTRKIETLDIKAVVHQKNPATQEEMIGELMKIAGECDGVRCDMAMLVLPEIFERTWGIPSQSFWPKAISRVRERLPDFCFMAEVYWDMEWTLQQQGFDYTYDKRLYDRLRNGHARTVREHFHAGLDYQNRLVRFLENHDEPRAAAAFPPGTYEAAAVITFLSPGLHLFHQGQFEGRKKKISPHLSRAPVEPIDQKLKQFYARLLAVLRHPAIRDGQWQSLECVPAWEDNWTWDCFLAFAWQNHRADRLLVTVNYAPNQSQCYVRLPFTDLGNDQWRFADLLGNAIYDRKGNDLQAHGLYIDDLPWKTSVFSLTRRQSVSAD
jgi:hypothetical protein